MNDKIKKIGTSIVTLIIFFIVASLVKNIIIKSGAQEQVETQNKDIDHVSIMYNQIALFVYYSIIFVGLSFVLPSFGVQKETIIALLGSVAIAIGISSQGALSNIWCGIIIMLNNVYNVGDVISINISNLEPVFVGRITSMNLFYTKLADVNTGNEITISNSLIYNASVSVNKSILYNYKYK